MHVYEYWNIIIQRITQTQNSHNWLGLSGTSYF